MEAVLDVYQQPYDAEHLLICMDEASRQIVSDLVEPLPMRPATPMQPVTSVEPVASVESTAMKPGTPKRVDDKYERHGVRSLLMFYNPLDGWRHVGCRESRTRQDWAEEVLHLLDVDYPNAKSITLVCDNLNTHDVASLYHALDFETAGRLRRRLHLVHTPKNGSWLNMAEIGLSILSRQCLGDRRFESAEKMDAAIAARRTDRNRRKCGTNWRFTTADARVKLKSLYPKSDICR